MTGEVGMSASPENLAQQLGSGRPGAVCARGCGRHASKGSGYRWCYNHDPSVPADERREALQLGGRRGVMTPAEVERLYADLDLKLPDDRNEARVRLLKARAAGRLTSGMYRDQLAGLDSIAKDQAKGQATPAPPLVVEVQRYGSEPGS